QFGKPISSFGAIQFKLAEQARRIFTTESALYRTAAYIASLEKQLLEDDVPSHDAAMQSAEEYAIECAMLVVAGSGALGYVVDGAGQSHGGYWFINGYEVSRT